MQHRIKVASGTFIPPGASAGARVVALEAAVDALLLRAVAGVVLMLVLMLLVLVAVGVMGSAAWISASMSSKSLSVSRRLPFLFLFGILGAKVSKSGSAVTQTIIGIVGIVGISEGGRDASETRK
jgi:hypothetical protein